jgi:hypothetical protein
MTKDDARNFIIALNAIQPYVPPLMFQPLAGSAVAKYLTDVANGIADERPKPHAVS